MKNFLLALIPKLTTKAAITAVACVTAGAAVSATTTAVIYNNKVEQYEKTIERLESGEQAGGNGQDAGAAPSTEARVVDGVLEIWDGTMWVSYGPVADVAAADPFYENSDKKNEIEKSVAERKLESLGLKVDENGEIVPIDPNSGTSVNKTEDGIMVLVGTTAPTASSKAAAQAKSSSTSNTPAPVVSNLTGVAGERTADPNLSALPATTITNTTWTASPSSGGGSGSSGGSSGGGSSDSGSSGGSSGGSVSAPASTPASAPVAETPSSSGGSDSGSSGGGVSDSGSSDSGNSDSGNSDSSSSDSSDGDDFSESYSEDVQ